MTLSTLQDYRYVCNIDSSLSQLDVRFPSPTYYNGVSRLVNLPLVLSLNIVEYFIIIFI